MATDHVNNPFFSIIVATFNAEKTIRRCLDNLLTQQFASKEILVQDGESTDRTTSIIASYRNKIAHFESYPDTGIYDAWNRALSHARGKWICFIGSDDTFIDKRVLTNYYQFLKTRDFNTRVVYGINYIVNSNGETLYTIGEPWKRLKAQFYKTMCLPHQGMMHHRTVFDDVGLFDDTYKIAGDYELLIRILKNSQPEHWPYPVCMTPLGGISTLPKNNLICLSEIKRAQITNGLQSNSLFWLKLWIGAFVRWMMWQVLGEKKSRLLLDAVRKARGLDPFWSRAF